MACICFCYAEASGVRAAQVDVPRLRVPTPPWRPGDPGPSPNADSCGTCSAQAHLGPVTQPERAQAVPLSTHLYCGSWSSCHLFGCRGHPGV
uniref:Uncharacterized protein n=1 Tax=Piliocolobus tephrosceles TaxID=591936 RepID=A0A8C9HP73_9PRIM